MTVFSRIQGGLGNQMFQLAAGMLVAAQRQQELILDRSFFASQSLRSLELEQFRINPTTVTGLSAYSARALHQVEALVARPSALLTEEREFSFDNRLVASDSGSSYLSGYWQSYHYLTPIETSLRTLFVPRAEYIRPIHAPTGTIAVSVHVRRGDYVTNPAAAAHHGGCSVDYYLRAMARMRELVPAAHFLIFSDGIEWARAHLPGDNVTFVEPHKAHSVVDLWRMRQCRHHILANSSYSWWAAWLGHQRGQHVIAPTMWLRSTPTPTDLQFTSFELLDN